jgi:hypothetical protein
LFHAVSPFPQITADNHKQACKQQSIYTDVLETNKLLMYGAEQTTVPAAGGGDADAAPASTAGAAASMPPPAAGGFKQRKNRGNLRKRAADEGGATGGGGGEDDETEVVRKAKQTKGDPLAFSTKKESKEDVVVTYASSQALPIGGDSGATRILETETEFDRDARCALVLRGGVRRGTGEGGAGGSSLAAHGACWPCSLEARARRGAAACMGALAFVSVPLALVAAAQDAWHACS